MGGAQGRVLDCADGLDGRLLVLLSGGSDKRGRFMNVFDELIKGLESIMNAITGGNLAIEKAIFNDPATIVIFSDGTKTVVKCQEGDSYDKRTGLLLCCAKRLFGNTGRYNDILADAVQGNASGVDD